MSGICQASWDPFFDQFWQHLLMNFYYFKRDCSKVIPVSFLFFGVELNLITLYLVDPFSVAVECTKESGKLDFAYT